MIAVLKIIFYIACISAALAICGCAMTMLIMSILLLLAEKEGDPVSSKTEAGLDEK